MTIDTAYLPLIPIDRETANSMDTALPPVINEQGLAQATQSNQPKRILFIHQNFPGQFRHVAQYLSLQPGYEIRAIGRDTTRGMPGVPLIRYAPHRQSGPDTHRYVRPLETGVLHGQAVVKVLLDLRASGWVPDVVLAHPGWGESLYVKDVFPRTQLIHFCEYFYRADGADVGFDPVDPVSIDDRARIRSKNALHLLALDACDLGICPTEWQKSLHPVEYQAKLQVIHEGVDTNLARPDPAVSFNLPDGRVLTRQDEVVTYVARNLEPYRGFPQFMRAIEQLQQQRPHVHVLIAGGDDVSYGKKPTDAANWREKLLQEVRLDPARTHFLGKLPYLEYIKLLQVSRAHIYLTYPFVLSWSMLEAMACGCVIIGSDTAPVREVIKHGENGYLVDFFDTQAQVAQLIQVLDTYPQQDNLRSRARQIILDSYTTGGGLTQYLQLLEPQNSSNKNAVAIS